MPPTGADTVHVRITTDGSCFIDDEYLAPPPGTSINEAVLDHLRLQAAAMEMPVPALIDDEQGNYQIAVCVNPDGTSQPLEHRTYHTGTSDPTSDIGVLAAPPEPTPPQHHATVEPIPPERPWEPLPEPYRTRLAAICSVASNNRFDDASRDADALLTELSETFGPGHSYTLAAGLVRGDIAWLTQDYQYGLQSWSFMAKTWHQLLGPQHNTTIRAVSNAVGCWRRLPPANALAASDDVITLLQETAIAGSGPAIRQIDRWSQHISIAN